MSIKGKMVVSFIIILIIMGAVMGYLLHTINATDRQYNDLIADKIWLKEQGLLLKNSFLEAGYSARDYLITGDTRYRSSYNQSVMDFHTRFSNMSAKSENIEAKALLENIQSKMAGYEKYTNDLMSLKDNEKTEEIVRYSLLNINLANSMSKAIDEFVEFEEKNVSQHISQSGQKVKEVSFTSLIIAALAIILSVIVAFIMSRSITRPLAIMSEKATLIAGGDMTTADIEVKGNDELGQVAKSFNHMKHSLTEFAFRISSVASKLSEQSLQLAAQAQQTSAGASQTAATIGEIAATVEKVAQNAQEVADAASDMASRADAGQQGLVQICGEIVDIAESTMEARRAIDELEGDISSINQFVDVITSIAEQTNLLALNAAIEAARAGEHGRGFSVVAEEVRNLAEESNQSAKKIRILIQKLLERSSQAVKAIAVGSDKVVQGKLVVEEVDASMGGIIKLVHGLTGQVQSVAAAAEQVSSSVQNMAATAEQQTAAMEVVATTADNLSSLAIELQELSGRFKLSGVEEGQIPEG